MGCNPEAASFCCCYSVKGGQKEGREEKKGGGGGTRPLAEVRGRIIGKLMFPWADGPEMLGCQ